MYSSLALPHVSLRALFRFFSIALNPVATMGITDNLPSALDRPPDVLHTPSPSPASIVHGATQDLTRDTVQFNIQYTVDKPSHPGSFALFQQPGILKLVSGRLSAEVVGALTVTALVTPSESATAFLLNGMVAVRQEPKTAVAVPDFKTVCMYPGAVPVAWTIAGPVQSLLSPGPGVHMNVLTSSVIGLPPRIYYAFQAVGIKEIHLVISGRVHLSGVGQVDF
jgi:hypothetical protein